MRQFAFSALVAAFTALAPLGTAAHAVSQVSPSPAVSAVSSAPVGTPRQYLL